MSKMKLLLITTSDVTVVDPNERHIRDPDPIRQFGEAIYALIDRDHLKKIVIDFSKVQLFSSAALGTMMAFKKKADAQQSRVVICCLRKELKDVFRLVGLDRQFELYADQEQALASFGASAS